MLRLIPLSCILILKHLVISAVLDFIQIHPVWIGLGFEGSLSRFVMFFFFLRRGCWFFVYLEPKESKIDGRCGEILW